MNDKIWKRKVDNYINDNYNIIKAETKNIEKYWIDDLLNDFYLFLINNKNRHIPFKTHYQYFFINRYYRNLPLHKYKDYKSISTENMNIFEIEEYEYNYIDDYNIEKEIKKMNINISNLSITDKILFDIIFIQKISSVNKLADFLDITKTQSKKLREDLFENLGSNIIKIKNINKYESDN